MFFYSEVGVGSDAEWEKESVRFNDSVTPSCSLRFLEMGLQLIRLGVNEEI
jgi:hypothetical protein